MPVTQTHSEPLRMQTFFGFSKIPFTKYMWATRMYDSQSQRELLTGLHCWIEVKGIAVVIGSQGTGKSITLRRFREELDGCSYQTYYLWNMRTTPLGLFRSLCRILQLPVRNFTSDMFDAISSYLGELQETTGKHPILIFDDCDNLSNDLLESLRLLTNFQMDCEDLFSIILCGTDTLLSHLRQPANRSFRQRVNFCHTLRPFTVEDTRNYIDFHLKRAEANPGLFSDNAIQLLFNLAKGIPRNINQLGIQTLIQAAIHKKEKIDENFIRRYVLSNVLLDLQEEEERQ